MNHFSSLTRYGLDDLNEGSITGLIGNIISLDSAITSLTSLIFNCEDIEDCTSIDSTGLFLLNGGQQVSMDLFDCSMQQVGVFIGEEAQLHIGQANVDVLSTLSLSLLTGVSIVISVLYLTRCLNLAHLFTNLTFFYFLD